MNLHIYNNITEVISDDECDNHAGIFSIRFVFMVCIFMPAFLLCAGPIQCCCHSVNGF